MAARSSIAISSLEPRLMGVAIRRSQCIIWSMPSTQSSMKQKLRVCEPSPQMSMVVAPLSMASITLRLRAAGAVDVVEAGQVGFQAAFRPILLAEHLRDEFLPAVASFGHGGVCVRFLERPDVRVPLQVCIVGAGGRRKEIALRAGAPGSVNQVGVDQNAAQALDAKVFDESHAAHVGGQIIDLCGAFDGLDGMVFLAQVQRKALHAGHPLVPFRQGLAVDGPDAAVAQIVKIPGERAGDEAARARDDDQIVAADFAVDSYFGIHFHDCSSHNGPAADLNRPYISVKVIVNYCSLKPGILSIHRTWSATSGRRARSGTPRRIRRSGRWELQSPSRHYHASISTYHGSRAVERRQPPIP